MDMHLPTVTVVSDSVEEVDDATLEALQSQAARDEASFRSQDSMPSVDPDNPFDVEIARPYAVDVRKLYEIAGKPIPAEISASLGFRVPVLICHGITPFYKGGVKPTGVWGLGYRAELDGGHAATISLFPGTQATTVAGASQRLRVGLSFSGGLSVDEKIEIPANASGLTVAGASVYMTTHQVFGLALDCSFSLLQVQSGPVGGGGAQWNLYRGRNRIDVYQPLYHTLLIPEGVSSLIFRVKTWVRSSYSWIPTRKARQWNYPVQKFEVSVASA